MTGRGKILCVVGALCAIAAITLLVLPYHGVVDQNPPEGVDDQTRVPLRTEAKCDAAIAQVLGLADPGPSPDLRYEPDGTKSTSTGPEYTAMTWTNRQPYCRTVARYRIGISVALLVIGGLFVLLALRDRSTEQLTEGASRSNETSGGPPTIRQG